MRRTIFALSVCLFALQPAFAQEAPGKPGAGSGDAAKQHDKAVAKEVADNWASAPVKEVTKSHEGKAVVDGKTIKYTATAGTLTIRDDKGKPQESMFYTAYTVPGEHRPVMFLYNGGPGSASLWLRMGSFAPERVLTKEPVAANPPPFDIIANHDTLIGSTDLVFIDAPSSGYSRALGDTPAKTFFGVDQDIGAFTKAIKRYVTKNQRWNDPKFIFGESYGTTRSAGLSLALQDSGVELNGVILLSSILNYGVTQPGYDAGYIGFLPTYAAVAWYHNKVDNKPADLATFVDQARKFAEGPYASALAKGSDLSPEETDQIARQLSHFTGISVKYIKDANLRIDLGRFRKELLRDRKETVGRFDGRYLGVDADAAGERPGYDPSDTGITGSYVGGFMDRLTRKFGYETELNYRTFVWEAYPWNWDWSHKGTEHGWGKQQMVDVAGDLGKAMRTNPHLGVLSLNGYYDMATPFFATEYDLKHLMLPKPQMDNLHFKYYPSGHMVYLNAAALHDMRLDVEKFIQDYTR